MEVGCKQFPLVFYLIGGRALEHLGFGKGILLCYINMWNRSVCSIIIKGALIKNRTRLGFGFEASKHSDI